MIQTKVSIRLCGAIALLCAILVFHVKPSIGGPGSVLNATDPLRSAPALETRALGVGDMTVASRTGAFEYSYPIAVPPGRLGNQPSLALTYSSQGALRGGIAAGWSLNIPEIKLEFPEGRANGGVYVSSMAGGHRLVPTKEPVSDAVAGLDTAYRAEYDDSYVRYSIDEDDDAPIKAVAMTLDGTIYYFGERHLAGGGTDATRWPLTHTVDKFGNVVTYSYSTILPLSGLASEVEEFVLYRISYGFNAQAGLVHFAFIRFDYTRGVSCNGTSLVAGASLNHRWKHQRTRGARKLERIETYVEDPSGGDNWQPVRTVALGYDLDAERCNAQHAPLRLLTSITEHAPAVAGDPSTGTWTNNPESWISKPSVVFNYGPLARSWNSPHNATGLRSLDKGSRSISETGTTAGLTSLFSRTWPTLDRMILDINGDGIVDRVDSVQPSLENNFQCQMRVRLGDGTSASLATSATAEDYDLPTLPWADEGTVGFKEGCSLSGQFTFHETRQLDELCGNNGSYLAYRFMDMNADGLPDLVTEISSDPAHFMAWDPDSGVDDTDLPLYDPDIPGSCPLVAPELLATAEVCRGGRDLCVFDQAAVKNILDTSASSPCHFLAKDARPHRGLIVGKEDLAADFSFTGTTPVDPAEPLCKHAQRGRVPQEHNGRYVWRWYENVDGVLSTQRRLTMSPIALTANAGDSGFGKGPLSNSSSHGCCR